MINFFIDRPIFAWVIAIVIMLLGLLSIRTLPVAQYPAIAPPSIAITGNYPGASAETVQNTVTQVIEQQMSGLDNLLYFSSESNKDGTVAKATRNFLMVVGFVSTDGSMNRSDISDFVVSTVQDPLSRTPGVGDYQVFGSAYAMRIWLDPARLHSYSLTPVDVVAAIREIGGKPQVEGQQLNATVIGPTRLQTIEDFENILLRVSADGAQVRLRDVARVALGGESESINALYNGQPASGIAIRLAVGANALDTADAVRATIEQLRPNFPQGLDVVYPYDTTPFVRLSIEEVVKTLFEAVVLVFLVMYLFLQNLRATFIPTIAVPVVLLGTFAVLAAAGFTINSLTMFATVLAIGLLVDDAIVVVENVERVMAEEGLSPKEATRKSMRQITGALIGIGLVLSAVFLPMAFFGGSTGVVYRQFSITIISAMALSVLVALIFTPALCSTVLKPSAHGGHAPRRGFFGAFNRGFDASNRRYQSGVQRMVQRAGRGMVIYLAIVVAMGWVYTRIPTAFLPDEDQGLMFLLVTAPPGAVSSRTEAALAQARDYLLNEEGEIVESVFTVSGFSFSGRGQNAGMAFVRLKDWAERPGAHNRVQALASRTPQRPVRRTSVQGRYRLGEGQRLRPDGQRHQQHAVCRMGIRVRQPVHRPRSRQAGFRSGRCAVTHESRRLRAVVRAQLGGRDGAVHGVFQRALGLRLTQARALQRHPFCADSWRAGAGLQHRRGNAGSRIADRKAAGGHRP